MHGFSGELLLPGVGEGRVLDPKATLARTPSEGGRLTSGSLGKKTQACI